MKSFMSAALLLILSILVISHSSEVIAQVCKPSGVIRGKNLPPCDNEDGSKCCLTGKLYPVYKCSPLVSNSTKAILTLSKLPSDGDISTLCDGRIPQRADDPIVVLSSGWYNGGERCLQKITIRANGRSITAKVIDVCDSTTGCNVDNDYQPPCGNNIVEASVGVWKALSVPEDNWGEINITWSDA